MTDSCSIIIPTINYNRELEDCINGCLKLKKVKIKIYVISDTKIKKKIKNTVFLSFGKINMSKKRNIGVSLSKTKYIAFLDSDCYPTKNWIYNAIKVLKKNKKIGLITGPDFPFLNQIGFQKTIGNAHKSFILSGSKIFRKSLTLKKIVKQASSCNMILERKTYNFVKGMDPHIYIGEDVDFCNRINKFYYILYTPNVKIFHKSREFLPFLAQRYAYGTCIFDTMKFTKTYKNFQYFVPLIITILFILSLFSYSYNLQLSFIYINIFFMLLVFIESLRLSNNPIEIIKLNIILILGVVFFGLGSISKILGFSKNIKSIYTYR